jgi:hypothetical protein
VGAPGRRPAASHARRASPGSRTTATGGWPRRSASADHHAGPPRTVPRHAAPARPLAAGHGTRTGYGPGTGDGARPASPRPGDGPGTRRPGRSRRSRSPSASSDEPSAQRHVYALRGGCPEGRDGARDVSRVSSLRGVSIHAARGEGGDSRTSVFRGVRGPWARVRGAGDASGIPDRSGRSRLPVPSHLVREASTGSRQRGRERRGKARRQRSRPGQRQRPRPQSRSREGERPALSLRVRSFARSFRIKSFVRRRSARHANRNVRSKAAKCPSRPSPAPSTRAARPKPLSTHRARCA